MRFRRSTSVLPSIEVACKHVYLDILPRGYELRMSCLVTFVVAIFLLSESVIDFGVLFWY